MVSHQAAKVGQVASVFIKRNPIAGGRSLECEAKGLQALRDLQEQHGILIPKVLKASNTELQIEEIGSSTPTEENWKKLGQGLARLHTAGDFESFGYESDNFIGLNPQRNTPSQNWGEFFTDHRLQFQVEMIQDDPLRSQLFKTLKAKRLELIDFLNHHDPKPSLVHGDLWSGNIMFSEAGPWVIDPAVYYADREVDLAMTRMFGGFHPLFYNSYNEVAPLPEGNSERAILYNLYHYLNHYNLFGSSYLSGVQAGFALIEALPSQ